MHMWHERKSGLVGASAVIIGLVTCAAMGQEYRSYDGTGNNIANPLWGSAGSQLQRLMPARYADGISAPAGANRPSARLASNVVCFQDQQIFGTKIVSNMVMQWGQWIDHDLGFKHLADPAEPFHIPVPTGDPFFDPTGQGGAVLSFTRSAHDPATGTSTTNPRQQITHVSTYIDSHTVYGWNPTRAAAIRSFVGGKLETGAGDLLPFNKALEPMDVSPFGVSNLADMMLAGDDRANTQLGLLAMHTLFLREHNRLCDVLAAKNPGWDDEKLYQEARRRVGALNQVVTFNEYLPTILGPGMIPPYTGYNPAVNATQSNEFAHAAFRFGHSQINQVMARMEENGFSIPQGPVRMRDQFFLPEMLVTDGGIEPLIRGMCFQSLQQVDFRVNFDVRNFLYGPPDLLGLDLASANIQRGRDHGLPSYNEARQLVGLPPITSFAQISSDPVAGQRLAQVYASVDDIDFWLGGLCEDHVPGGVVGPLFATIVANEFIRVRDGDRFWYQNNQFSPAETIELFNTRLSDIILRNTPIQRIQRDVFFIWPDFNLDGVLNLADFGKFQTQFARGDMNADFDKNGVLNIDDFILFEIAFSSY